MKDVDSTRPGVGVAPLLPSVSEGPTLERGATLGRYVIFDWLGGGGMGVVYTAYDPKLDRRIAIKLLRPDDDRGESQARFLREAQAMARVAHPNVISVYDVGTIGNDAFLAMEFVEGETLKQWLKSASRSRAEVLGVFRQAGRGLAAAHAGGLVHRDFKPENVIVGKDGRARVLDFGLACAENMADVAKDQRPPEVLGASALTETITKTAGMLGTPAYMSPELWRGMNTDARSDQFSFCIALYEALYGERPFRASTPMQFRLAVMGGHVGEPPAGSKVPAWLRAVVLRGLSVDRNQRHPSMDALLQALHRDPSAVRRRWAAVVAAGVTALAVVGFGYRGVARQRSALCTGSNEQLAGVWDEPRRQAMHDAFAASKLAYAEDAFAGAARAIDELTRNWVAMRQGACEATRLRGEQSEELMDLRMQCLGQKREEVRALVDVFTEADASVVAKSVQAASGLGDLASCANAVALRAPVRPPADPHTRAKVQDLRKTLARAKALENAARYADGMKMAIAVRAEAREMGYRPLEAEASYLVGHVQEMTGKDKEAQATQMETVALAEAAHHDEVAARAWSRLVRIGTHAARYADAQQWSRVAEAAMERAGAGDRDRGVLLLNQGILLAETAKYGEALAHYRRALALSERALGPQHPTIASLLVSMGVVLTYQSKRDEALANYRRALAIYEHALGPDHPDLTTVLLDLGLALAYQNKNDEALAYYRRGLAIAEKSLTPENTETAALLAEIGNALATQGKYDEALRYCRRALGIQESQSGGSHPDVAYTLQYIGNVLAHQGKLKESLAVQRRALAIMENAFGPKHPDVAAMLVDVADLLFASRSYPEALRMFERAVEIWETSFGADHDHLASPLTGVGKTLVGMGKPARAVAPLERALALRAQSSPATPEEVAETQFALARALWEGSGDRAYAHRLAERAHASYVEAGPKSASERDAIEAWLAKHASEAPGAEGNRTRGFVSPPL